MQESTENVGRRDMSELLYDNFMFQKQQENDFYI